MQRKLWLALAFTGVVSWSCGGRPEAELICDDNIDNDGDGAGDCADIVDCSNEPKCKEEVCDNGFDDNEDGLQDCADPDCAGDPSCVEVNCGDQVDNDNDTDIDCDDSDCAANALCACGNGDIDAGEDCDGQDLGGESCTTVPGGFTGGNLACDANCNFNTQQCTGGTPEDCDNNLDDDNDGDTDCADSECSADPDCQTETGNCADGLDNDGDNFTDCDDFDCTSDPACGASPEVCTGGVDEDLDSFIDCNDFDCDDDPACGGGGVEVCTGGLDEDGDSFIDCNDFDCDNDPACVPVGGTLEIQEVQVNPQDNAVVTLENVFVTAIKGAAGQSVTINVQEPQGETPAGLTYPERAGMGLFIAAAQSGNFTLPTVGQCVTVTGSVDDFNGQTQLSFITALTIVANTASCGTAPSPFVIPSAANPAVTFADVATDLDPVAANNQEGPLTEVYECVLVTVQNVRVVADVDQFDEFPIAEQSNATGPRLNIDDFFVDFDDIAELGLTVNQNLTSVTGIYNDVFNFKIQIRNNADIVP